MKQLKSSNFQLLAVAATTCLDVSTLGSICHLLDLGIICLVKEIRQRGWAWDRACLSSLEMTHGVDERKISRIN